MTQNVKICIYFNLAKVVFKSKSRPKSADMFGGKKAMTARTNSKFSESRNVFSGKSSQPTLKDSNYEVII